MANSKTAVFATLCCLLMLCSEVVSGELENLVVKTTLGSLRGTKLGILGHDEEALAFRNIPYAAPPIGSLRFQPTQPKDPWSDIRDATKFGPACPTSSIYQPIIKQFLKSALYLDIPEDQAQSEDCLSLNVYSPGLTGKQPVMVFFHGGGLQWGDATTYDMRVMAIKEGIVGVVVQYRLGPLGWLSTGNNVIPGNMGFRDQVAALQWVQDNIANFGGDPDKVTIFGESAGSWSVSMHIFSPLSTGLFHRAILQSCSLVGSSMVSPPVDEKKVSKNLASTWECPTDDSNAMIECLLKIPANELVEKVSFKPEYVPRVDNECLPDVPSNLLAKGEYNSNVDIIAGVNDVEGYLSTSFYFPNFNLVEQDSPQIMEFINNAIIWLYPSHADQWDTLAKAAFSAYIDGKRGDDLQRSLVKLLGDGLITYSTYETALVLAGSSRANTFFYEFKHKGQFSSLPDYISADHGDELRYVFGSSYISPEGASAPAGFNRDDKVVEAIIRKYWGNFARTGDPNGIGLPKWPQLKENHSYLVLGTNPYVGYNYEHEQNGFLSETGPGIIAETLKQSEGPIVEISSGKIKGTMLSVPNIENQAYGFLGIPYVAPPVGELRFQPPQALAPWDGTRDASKPAFPCIQIMDDFDLWIKQAMDLDPLENRTTSEDCLYLNVYTPALTGSRPVMVFIHGGGFTSGWASTYDMRAMALKEGIVGVTIQYRLGSLGWLSTGDDVVPGNMGFQDQVAALQWVQNNIAKFGGDPDKVTIFGESAGSKSVAMHLISPLSQGLFHRGIMLSGSVLQPNFLFSPPTGSRQMAEKLASALGCPIDDSESMITCLRKCPAEQFISTSTTEMFTPRVDKTSIPDLPSILLQTGNYNSDVDIIAGVNTIEGYFMGQVLFPDFLKMDPNNESFKSVISQIMAFLYPNQPDKWSRLTEAAFSVYATNNKSETIRQAFEQIVGDFIITGATYQTAMMLAGRYWRNTFFYEFKHQSAFSEIPKSTICDHGSELYFVFGVPSLRYNIKNAISRARKDDHVVEGMVMKYWANFAHTGDPNGDGLPRWPQLNENDSFLVLNTNPSVEHNYQHDRMKLWSETIPNILSGENSNKHDEL